MPESVFQQPESSIARFLCHLWATDGCVFLGRAGRRAPLVYYATSSPVLARDVQSLLLRLGINAILSKVNAKRGRTQYHVKLTGVDDILRFLSAVGCIGDRKEAAGDAILQTLSKTKANTNRDVIPAAAWRNLVTPALATSGITTREFQAGLGTAYCGTALYKSNLSRERAARAARVCGSNELRDLADSDVYWDSIASIEADGEEEVYDLTIDGLHNFVADDIVVHNSIEQDADLVMFVYRDEYYNQESERLGEADLIVSKHRNGPIGRITLSFLPKYPKFASLYRDRGAGPALPAENGSG